MFLPNIFEDAGRRQERKALSIDALSDWAYKSAAQPAFRLCQNERGSFSTLKKEGCLGPDDIGDFPYSNSSLCRARTTSFASLAWVKKHRLWLLAP